MKKKSPKHRKTGSSQPDLNHMESLVDFMATHNLEEFEFSRGDLHIRLKKPSANTSSHQPRAQAMYESSGQGAVGVQEPSPEGSPPPAGGPQAATGEELHTIKSPIVGTYFEAPTPGNPPYVRIGDQVQAGQVLCIVEAMKLMNEIESDVAGEVTKILVENGQPVEYGQPLFLLRPVRKK